MKKKPLKTQIKKEVENPLQKKGTKNNFENRKNKRT